jgi:hypothetical protein
LITYPAKHKSIQERRMIMSYARLDRVADSKGSNCSIVVSGVEWQVLLLFGQIDKVTKDANGDLVIEAPLANSPKPPGFDHTELKNEQEWKGLKIICRESVIVFGNDEMLSINAGAQWAPVIQVVRAAAATQSLKDCVRIEE